MLVEYKDVLENSKEVRDIANELLELVVVGNDGGFEHALVGTVTFDEDQEIYLSERYFVLVGKLKKEVAKL